jgi:hypothetical protein
LSPTVIDALPVWRIETLLVFIAAHPAGYRGWPTIGEWLDEAVRKVDKALILEELAGRTSPTWARIGYILEMAGGFEVANRIHEHPRSKRPGPFYLGSRKAAGTFNKRWNVRDSLLWRSYSATRE